MGRRTAALLGTFVALIAVPSAATADTSITVTTTNDPPPAAGNTWSTCSLRAAVSYADATSAVPASGTGSNACVPQGGTPSGTTTINLPAQAPTHYGLTRGELVLSGGPSGTKTVIAGSDQRGTIVDAGGLSRIFLVQAPATVTVSSMTLTGGNPGVAGASTGPQAGVDGGAILDQGTLTLTSDTLQNDHAGDGVTCSASCTSSNGGSGGSGGAVYVDGAGTLTVKSSTMANNRAGNGSAGSVGSNGTVAYFASLPAGSGSAGGAGGDGGAIYSAGTLTVSGSAVSQNRAGRGGDGGNGGNGGDGGTGGFDFGFGCTPTVFAGQPGASGGSGGSGGHGGGVESAAFGTGVLDTSGAAPSAQQAGQPNVSITTSSIAQNATGNAGDGGSGGGGGNGDGNGSIGNCGNSPQGGDGGNGGAGGAGGSAGGYLIPGAGAGVVIDAPRVTGELRGTSVTNNSAGSGGAGGTGGTAGQAGTSGGAHSPGTPGNGANGGNGGGGAGVTSSDTNTGYNPVATIANSTISGNVAGNGGAGGTPGGTAGAGGGGGGIEGDTYSTTDLSQDTVAGNRAPTGIGGGIYSASPSGALRLYGTVLASNTGNPSASGAKDDCGQLAPAAPVLVDNGFNVYGGSFAGCPTSSNQSKQTPGAVLAGGAAQDNGSVVDSVGPLQTLALAAGGPAVDLVPPNRCEITDERGVSRPQPPGGKCDAGAYELSPPAVSGASGSATSTSGAAVSASVVPQINPGGAAVSVRYGATTAYGSTAGTTTLPAGSQPAAFSATLSGLQPNTTYHYQVVAANSDGTSASPDATFTTPPGVSAQIASVTTSGPTATIQVSCGGGDPGNICAGPVAVTSHLTRTAKGAPTAAAASKKRRKRTRPKTKPKPKTTTANVTIGAATYSVPTGHTAAVRVVLNADGLKALSALYVLPATVSIGGTSAGSAKTTFRYTRTKGILSRTWTYTTGGGVSYTTASAIVVTRSLPGTKVQVVCAGRGCRFSRATRKTNKKGFVDLKKVLNGSRLAPGARLEVWLTFPGTIGVVHHFTLNRSPNPHEVILCLPPGARRPLACVRTA